MANKILLIMFIFILNGCALIEFRGQTISIYNTFSNNIVLVKKTIYEITEVTAIYTSAEVNFLNSYEFYMQGDASNLHFQGSMQPRNIIFYVFQGNLDCFLYEFDLNFLVKNASNNVFILEKSKIVPVNKFKYESEKYKYYIHDLDRSICKISPLEQE